MNRKKYDKNIIKYLFILSFIFYGLYLVISLIQSESRENILIKFVVLGIGIICFILLFFKKIENNFKFLMILVKFFLFYKFYFALLVFFNLFSMQNFIGEIHFQYFIRCYTRTNLFCLIFKSLFSHFSNKYIFNNDSYYYVNFFNFIILY